MLTFNGIQIFTDPNRTVRQLHARSPSRAKRRLKLGHQQCWRWVPDLSILKTPMGLVMHPLAYESLKVEVSRRTGDPA